MNKVAITGGAGFLGGYVQRELRARDIESVVLDITYGDDVVKPGKKMVRLFEGCNSVIHLAGVLGTAELFDNPQRAVDVNVKGTLNVLEACKKVGAGFVGISMPECWPNVYQATKYCAKSLATAWHLNFGLKVSHVRAYNAYGIGQAYGPGHPQKIIPTFATKIARGEKVPVWGDGNQRADLISAIDIAKMLVDATRFGGDEVFDAGTGADVPVLAVVKMVAAILEKKADVEFLPMRLGETPTNKTWASGEGWDKLGWRPLFDVDFFRKTVLSYA